MLVFRYRLDTTTRAEREKERQREREREREGEGGRGRGRGRSATQACDFAGAEREIFDRGRATRGKTHVGNDRGYRLSGRRERRTTRNSSELDWPFLLPTYPIRRGPPHHPLGTRISLHGTWCN